MPLGRVCDFACESGVMSVWLMPHLPRDAAGVSIGFRAEAFVGGEREEGGLEVRPDRRELPDIRAVAGEDPGDRGGVLRTRDEEVLAVTGDVQAGLLRTSSAWPGEEMPRRTCGAPPPPRISLTAPSASVRPWPMMVTVSATCSTSARMCELTRIVLPALPSVRIVSRTSRMPAGSRPLVGSSKMSSSSP